jgi:uncharacterized cupredoxin-like copper-binding protein
VGGVIASLSLGPAAAIQAGQTDATPESTPAPVRCDVPLQTDVQPAAAATPVASPAATPLAEDDGDEAELVAVTNDIERLARTLALCLSDEEYETAARLVTPVYRGLLVGTGEELDRATFVEVMQSLTATPLTIRSVSDVQLEADNRASAEVVSVVANELVRGRWSFELVGPETGRPRNADDEAEPNRRWVITSEEALEVEPPEEVETVDVTLSEYVIELDPDEVTSSAAVLNIVNEGELDHEVVVLRLEGDATIESLIYQAGPALPEGITFAGQINVAAGEEATMTLVDLEPGTYGLADLSPDAQGVINLIRGMGATLTVS